MSATLEEYRARLREALAVINDLKSRVQASERTRNEPIAVVGIGCRFPGGGSGPEAFFQALLRGVDAVREIPEARWPAAAIPGDRPEARWAALLDDLEGLDAAFFGISPREAASLDPQQRLLLEVSWEALEDAGQRPDRLMGSRTGVFVGVGTLDYQQRMVSMGMGALDAYSASGNLGSTAAGRLSYVLGLEGPAMTIDTACSSSLVAIHLACNGLRSGECDIALAGGANAIVSPFTMAMLVEMRALSPDGRCKTFDARANGYARGEGSGIVVLKRLSDAQRDGDRIRALVRGSAVNQDGRSTGLTAPNVLSQQALLRQALERARLAAEAIGYIETHGTGTPLGDPIEYDALKAVLGNPRTDDSRCVLGALKTNIGHLEGAAGVAGFIKAALALEHGEIPRNLHFQTLNPRMEAEDAPLSVPTENVPWKRDDKPRYAGVSSFGVSGTNAHVVLEEAPRVGERAETREVSAHLLPLSAKSAEALVALAGAYAKHLSADSGESLAEIAYTASVRRMHHEHRLAVVGRTTQEIADALLAFVRGESPAGVFSGRSPLQTLAKVTFVFPGQGSQWLGMGRQLLSQEPAFRASLEASDEVIRRESGFSVLEELAADGARARLGHIGVVQPLLFAIDVALCALWRAWGVEPDCVVGHSMGEVAAAHVAGMLSLEDAARVVCRRSRLLERVSGKGAMALVELTMTDAETAIAGYEGRLGVAVSNGPRSTVLAGDVGALEEVVAALEKRGVFCRHVKVDVASHSPQVEPLREDLLAALCELRPRAGKLAMWSTVNGQLVQGPELDADYWAKNLREPVRFSQVTQRLLADGYGLFVEMSPHPILLPSIEENLREAGNGGAVVASLRRQADERRCMLEALGALYTQGYPLEWSKLYPEGGRPAPLPSYPWQRQRYWLDGAAFGQPSAAPRDPLDDCVYEIRWRKKERPAPAHKASLAQGAWLLFTDAGGVGDALSMALRERGEAVVRVVRGQRYERTTADEVQIDPSSRGDYRRLLEESFGKGRRCRGVVHLWALDAAPLDGTTGETLQADQRLGVVSALHLTQALLRQGWRDKPRLHLVTRGAQAAGEGQASVEPAQAPLWGFSRSLSLEHPELECVRVDLDPAGGADEALALADELAAADGEDQVALRQGSRLVARLSRSRFEDAPVHAFRFEAQASYVVTGGLGALGLSAARWMVERGSRHVALVGRREPTRQAREQIRAMEQAGAEVLVLSGDVSLRADAEAALRAVDERLPELRGIVHAAGIVDDHTLLELSEEHCRSVLAPKMHGAWNLHALTSGRRLDFFVMYSSAASLMGSPGQANYAAANAFMDSLSHARRARGLPATSIHWGAFADVGLAAAQENRGARLAERGFEGLAPAEGNHALGRLLERPRAEVGIVRFDIRHWLEFYPQMASHPFFSELGSERSTTTPRQQFRPALEAATPSERLGLLEGHLRDHLARVLRMNAASIDRRTPFRVLGVDSLMSLEVRNRVEASLGIRLSATLLFTYPDLAALAEGLLGELHLAQPADGASDGNLHLPPEAGERGTNLDEMAGSDLLALLDEELALARKGKKP
jgi:acyl transferase domain-containing protein/acyl carrier protein